MADRLSRDERSSLMKRIRSKDTGPELAIRKLLHAEGYRFRLHGSKLPGKPDLVFSRRRCAVFVNGCYWHGHGCARGGTGAKSNASYWGPKIARTRERDAQNIKRLNDAGWRVFVVWECETRHLEEQLVRLKAFLGDPKTDDGTSDRSELGPASLAPATRSNAADSRKVTGGRGASKLPA